MEVYNVDLKTARAGLFAEKQRLSELLESFTGDDGFREGVDENRRTLENNHDFCKAA